jgi:hypothetical protein
MAGLNENTDDTPVSAEAAASESVSKDPFQGDSQVITWARDLEMGQLQVEITEALGPDVRLAAFFQYDDQNNRLPVDAQHPVSVYVTPSSAPMAAVRQVLATHKPDPYYGMTDEEKAQVQLKEKISSGATLSPDEVQRALQMLVLG